MREDEEVLPLYEPPKVPSYDGPPAISPSVPSLVQGRQSTPAREALEMSDRRAILQDVDSASRMQGETMSSDATAPGWSGSLPSLVHSHSSSSASSHETALATPSSSFASVPGPRTLRSNSSMSSFEEGEGLTFAAGSPGGVAETFDLPSSGVVRGPVGSVLDQDATSGGLAIHNAIVGHGRMTRAKAVTDPSRLSDFMDTQDERT